MALPDNFSCSMRTAGNHLSYYFTAETEILADLHYFLVENETKAWT